MSSKHLTLDEYLMFIENRVTVRSLNLHKKFYKQVITKWPTSKDWFKSDIKTIYINNSPSDFYWINWSLCKCERLPIDFIKSIKVTKCEEILKAHLSDFNELESGVLKLRSEYKGDSVKKMFKKVMQICLLLGVSSAKNISFKDLAQAFVEKILDMQEFYFMEELLRGLGYISIVPVRSKEWKSIVREQRDLTSKSYWSNDMQSTINEFLHNMEMSKKIDSQMRIAKEGHINQFGNWYIKALGEDIINELRHLNRDLWLKYASTIIEIDTLSDKTKYGKLITIVQFFDWIKTNKQGILPKEFIYDREDFKILDIKNYNDNLAFQQRVHAERILNYLVNKFESDSIKDKFYREAIIIYANSGVRYSELRDMEYDSVFFSKDEGLYKTYIGYEDKLGQVNRPVYFTRDGYEAIRRVEELRKKYSKLEERYNKRAKKSFIHLFEYAGVNPLIEKKYIHEFLARVKYRLNLIDENGRCIKGNLHAYRHFFSMTVFRLSNYNLSVVRYLLGHRSYEMSKKYLKEENSHIYSMIREEKEQKKVAGKGIDTLCDFICERISTHIPLSIKKHLSSDKYLIDILNSEDIKRIDIGFCLNPCNNANKCFKCKFYLVTENEKNQLASYLCDLIGIVTYKIQKSNKSINDAINIPSIAEDLDDITILCEELRNLGVTNDELSTILENGKR